ncbi:MAG: carbon-nitrogen hydrolase family protein [Candidatus Latescibacteria bacterium]|nr:carbon-nitrogen hydrolase family protein [Candidatus Latescibacterota bacterium]
MNIRIAACQILTFPSPKESADKMLHWMRLAAKDGVQVVAFPEAGICGYPCTPDYWKAADPKVFRAAERRIERAAKQLGIAVVLGTVHWEEGQLFNSLLLIDRDGTVKGRYSKTHLAERWPAPGRRLFVTTLAGVLSCFIICHDVRYPELVRLPAIAGAQVCYFCSNESGLTEEYKLSAYRAMPIARATENTVYVVMANAPANADDLRSPSQSHGNSKVIHPDGTVICEAGFFEERLMAATVDLNAATRAMALRSVNDETILKAWMQEGVKLVEKI